MPCGQHSPRTTKYCVRRSRHTDGLDRVGDLAALGHDLVVAFGTAHKLPSGRYRAMYYGPDGRRYTAATTFTSKAEARAWLALRQSEIVRKAWEPPEAATRPGRLTFGAYAEQWMTHRQGPHPRALPLAARRAPDPRVRPAPAASITSDDVRSWHTGFGTGTPTVRSHCYGLLRSIMGSAASDGQISLNPCVIPAPRPPSESTRSDRPACPSFRS